MHSACLVQGLNPGPPGSPAAHLAASHFATTATHEAGQAPLALRWRRHGLLINSLLLIAKAARVTIATAAKT